MMNKIDGGSRSGKPPMFYVMLVVVSFCAWIASRSFLGKSPIAFLLGWASLFNWTEWLGALVVAVGGWQWLMLYRIGYFPSADEMLFSFDKLYGYPEFFLKRMFWSAPVILTLAKAIYLLSVMPVVVVYLALRDGALRRRLCTSFALIRLSGVVFYQFCPAAGPIYVFRQYPWIVPTLSPEVTLLPHLIMNATPSIHLAMAVLVVFYSRYCSRLCHIFGWTCLVLTVLVTLGLGEHYVIDLVLGVPFAVAIDCVPYRSQRRKAYGCVLLVLAWEFALCHGLALQLPASVALLLSCMTVAAPFAPRFQISGAELAAIAETE
jgi:hypothetical protein